MNALVATDKEALDLPSLETFLRDGRWEQTDWRYIMDKEMDYYDGKQLDSETISLMEERGIPPMVRNIVAPVMDSIVGLEKKSRRDLKVEPHNEEDGDFALGLDKEFKKAWEISLANEACSTAYKGEACVGLGWIEVGRKINPFATNYNVANIHRREMWWDMRADSFQDGRYCVRRKWYDIDQLKAVFPNQKELINQATGLWATFDEDLYRSDSGSTLTMGFDQFRSTDMETLDWLDSDRQRACLYQVMYRVFVRGKVLRYKDTVVEFDPKNEIHKEILKIGAVLEDAVMPKMRLAYWIGPHQIGDWKSPLPHNDFPFTPFMGFTEDRTHIPYGLIRRQMSSQDGVNARLSKMMWLLSSKRIISDSDAFADDDEVVLDEVSRSNAFMRLNPNRENPGQAPEITTEHRLADQQFQVLQDEIQSVYRTGGQQGAYRAENDKSVESNVMLQSLLDTTTTTLSELIDNYSLAKKQVGMQLLSFVQEDLKEDKMITTLKKGKRIQVPVFNTMTSTNGEKLRYNALAKLKARIVMEETPNTSTYKKALTAEISEIAKSLPDELQMAFAPALVELMSIPQKESILANIKQITGIGEDSGEMQQQKAKEQQMAMEQLQDELDKVKAEIRKINADTDLKKAQTQKALVDGAKSQVNIGIDDDTRQMALEAHEKEMSAPPEKPNATSKSK